MGTRLHTKCGPIHFSKEMRNSVSLGGKRGRASFPHTPPRGVPTGSHSLCFATSEPNLLAPHLPRTPKVSMSEGCLEWEPSENRWREGRKKKGKEPGPEIVIEVKKEIRVATEGKEGNGEASAGSRIALSFTETQTVLLSRNRTRVRDCSS